MVHGTKFGGIEIGRNKGIEPLEFVRIKVEVIRKALACAHNARTRETNQKKVPHYAERDQIPQRKVAQT